MALDAPVVLFTLVLSFVTGLIFGIVPAMFATGNANDVLREGGRHGSGPRARRALGTLVVAEVALSLVLLAGAGLLIRSFIALQNVDPGMRTEGVLTARVALSGQRYDTDQQLAGFFTDVLSRIAVIPGVTNAAAVSFLPLQGLGIGTSFYRLDQPIPQPGDMAGTAVKPVTPNFFRTMGIPQRAGRDFAASDTTGLATGRHRQRRPRASSSIRTRIRSASGIAHSIGAPAAAHSKREIVGVVGDIKMVTLDGTTAPAVYIPHTQLPIGVMTFVVRTSLEPTSLTPSVAAAVRAVDREPAARERGGDGRRGGQDAGASAHVSALLTVFAFIALVLAGVGVYGVMAYAVSQRTQEIGVRMALGATTQSVFRMMIGDALRLVTIGIVAGVIAAAWLSQFLTTMLFQTQRFDVLTFAVTALVLGLVATFASYVPAQTRHEGDAGGGAARRVGQGATRV